MFCTEAVREAVSPAVVSYEKTNDETGYIPLEGDSYYENPYRVTYNSNEMFAACVVSDCGLTIAFPQP